MTSQRSSSAFKLSHRQAPTIKYLLYAGHYKKHWGFKENQQKKKSPVSKNLSQLNKSSIDESSEVHKEVTQPRSHKLVSNRAKI